MAYTGTDKDGGIGYVTKSEKVRVRDVVWRYVKRIVTAPVRLLKR